MTRFTLLKTATSVSNAMRRSLAPKILASRPFSVVVTSDHHDSNSPFRQIVSIGQHTIISDEPAAVGGLDEGPSPYQLLCSALGSCTAMTMQMYAARKKLPLEKVEVKLLHQKVYAKDLEDVIGASPTTSTVHAKIDKFERIITLHGPKLSEEDRKKLFEIANKCPVHRTLESKSVVTSTLAPVPEPLPPATDSFPTSASDVAAGVRKIDPKFDLMIPSRLTHIVPGFAVKRVLPFHSKRAVSAFVFLDHFHNPVNEKSPEVGPHPHIGLATLTYLYEGVGHHRDSTGADAVITPGAVNYMIAGKGCVHSERIIDVLDKFDVSASKGVKKQHGLQIWVALAKEEEQRTPQFIGIPASDVPDVTHLLQEFPDERNKTSQKSSAKLVVGSFGGVSTKIPIHPSLNFFFLDVTIAPHATINVAMPEGVEYGIYNAFDTAVWCNNHDERWKNDKLVLREGDFPVFNTFHVKKHVNDQPTLCLTNPSSDVARIAVLGGVPLPEPRHIFWNFVATDKKLIEQAADKWRVLDRSQFPAVVNESNDDSIPLPKTNKASH